MKNLKTVMAGMLMFVAASMQVSASGTSAQVTAGDVEPTHFILCLNGGKQVAFLLEHTPKVVNGEGVVTVIDEDVTIEYAIGEVHKYMMGVDSTTDGISNITGSDRNKTGEIDYRSGDVMMSGFDAGTPVKVFDTDGVLLSARTINSDGGMVLEMSQYPAGIYIVKVQNKTFKFIKR